MGFGIWELGLGGGIGMMSNATAAENGIYVVWLVDLKTHVKMALLKSRVGSL